MRELKIKKTTLKIGIKNPITFIHTSDTHIAHDDERVSNRAAIFDACDPGRIEDYFFKTVEYAKEKGYTIVHTGDLIDFTSNACFDFVDKYFNDVDYIYAAGNHDFCHWVGEAKEDLAYKWEQFKVTAPHFKNNLYFYSRMIGEVNFVTLDNSYSRITYGQLDALKAEVAKGHPIILCMHVPLYSPAFDAEISKKHGGKEIAPLYNMGVPEDIQDAYIAKHPEVAHHKQILDEASWAAVDYIKNEPAIKALLVGHRHDEIEGVLENGTPQIMAHGTFSGYIREITVE